MRPHMVQDWRGGLLERSPAEGGPDKVGLGANFPGVLAAPIPHRNYRMIVKGQKCFELASGQTLKQYCWGLEADILKESKVHRRGVGWPLSQVEEEMVVKGHAVSAGCF